MKKIFTLSAFAFIALSMNAQVFWTENFGLTCSRGQLASAYTGSNGTWSIATTGTNDPYADGWFVSGTASGTGVGNCSISCLITPSQNSSLHIGNAAFVIPNVTSVGADTGSTYLTGVFCSLATICSTTHKRVQSPTINCTGKTNITLSCLYYEGGEAAADFSTLVYSADNGVTWSNLNAMPMTTNTSCTAPFGKWTAYTYALPATANNNATVKIGFNWVNNNNAAGVDPSFAVDDIKLTQSPTGVNEIATTDLNIYSSESNIIIKTESAYKLIAVTDILGNMVRYTQLGNTLTLSDHSTGIYFVQVEIDGIRFTKKVMLQ